MRSGKRQITKEIDRPNQEKIRTLGEKETYKNLEILEVDVIEQAEMTQKYYKRVSLENKKTSRNQTIKQNLTKETNTCSVFLVRYSGPFLKLTREEVQQMDQRTRKLITVYKALHPRDDKDMLYVSRNERGKHASIKDSVDTSIRRLEDSIKKNKD